MENKILKPPQLFKNGRGNRDVFIPSYPAGAGIDFKKILYLKELENLMLFIEIKTNY
jgi:hypothetical protein